MGILVYCYLLQAATNAFVRLSRAQHSPSPLYERAAQSLWTRSTRRKSNYRSLHIPRVSLFATGCMPIIVCSARSKLAWIPHPMRTEDLLP